jgi:predicted pyridoxine 5'-phosphate oxidase superfamily flavin-nucleotide-binding protein
MKSLSLAWRGRGRERGPAVGVLTAEMRRVVDEQRLGFVATVCPDGTPNLSPKGTTMVWDDDHLVFADICSPGTVANLRHNPAIEINVVDPILRTGFRFKGTATVHRDDERFAEIVARYRARGSRNPIQSVVLVRVEQVAPLWSPAYHLGMTEAEIRDRWIAHYAALHGEARGADANTGAAARSAGHDWPS